MRMTPGPKRIYVNQTRIREGHTRPIIVDFHDSLSHWGEVEILGPSCLVYEPDHDVDEPRMWIETDAALKLRY